MLRPYRALIRRTMLTPEQGAAAALRLATDPALNGVTSRYFVKNVEADTPAVSYNTSLQQRLLDSSERFYSRNRHPAA